MALKAGTIFIAVKGDLNPLDKALQSAWKSAEKRSKDIEKRFTKLERRVKRSWRSISMGIKDALIGIALGKVITDAIKLADRYTLLNSRIKLVTTSTKNYVEVQQDLFEISQKSRTGYETTVEIFTRLARATKNTSVSQSQMLQVTEALNKATIVSGATTTEATNALIQLSQGLASNRLGGEELRSVMEQIPYVAQQIAAGLGVDIGKFREMSKEGLLTTETVVNALLSQVSVIDNEYSKMPLTISQSWTMLGNTVGLVISKINEHVGITNALASALDSLNSFLEKGTGNLDRYLDIAISGFKDLAELAAVGGGLYMLPIVITNIHKALVGLNVFLFKAQTGAFGLNSALFGTSVSSRLAEGSLSKMQVAGYALFAFFAGWKLGKWANENFEEVRLAGLAAIAGLDEAWITYKFNFLQLWTDIKFGAMESFDSLKTYIADIINDISEKMSGMSLTITNPFGDDFTIGLDKASTKLKTVADNMRESADTTKKHNEATVALRGEMEKAIDIHDRTVDAMIKERTWIKKVEKQDIETTKKRKDNSDEILEKVKERTPEQLALEEDLQTKIHELTTNEYEHQLYLLDKEIEALTIKAGDDKALQDQIAEYRALKQDEINEKHDATLEQMWEAEVANADTTSQLYQTMTDAYIRGENAKEAVARLAVDKLSGFAAKAAEKGLPQMLEALGQAVGAWIGFGVSETATEGESWQEKLASGAGYLAAAAAAILAGKAVGKQFAEGGWIGANPNGGVIHGGSGFRDDVFLGYSGGGIPNYGMGNEYVMPRDKTARYLPQLEAMRAGRYAEGGIIGPGGDPLRAAEEMNNNGFDLFADSVVRTGGNWKKAIAEAVAWYIGSGVGMIGGKVFGAQLFADGGQVDKEYNPDDIVIKPKPDPGGGTNLDFESDDPLINEYLDWIKRIIDEAEKSELGMGDIPSLAMDLIPWDNLWEWLRDRGGRIEQIIGDADRILSIFLKDVYDPDRSVTNVTFESMIKEAYDAIAREVSEVVDNTIDPLGIMPDPLNPLDPFDIFHDGTGFVPKTGKAIVERGERILSREDNEEIMNLIRNGTSGINIESKPIIKVMIGAREIKDMMVKVIDDYTVRRNRRGVTTERTQYGAAG